MDFVTAQVGVVLQVPTSDPIPEDWHILDGSLQDSARYPLFVAQLGIIDPTFTLPAPIAERLPDGRQFIIKLGERDDDAPGSADFQEARRGNR